MTEAENISSECSGVILDFHLAHFSPSSHRAWGVYSHAVSYCHLLGLCLSAVTLGRLKTRSSKQHWVVKREVWWLRFLLPYFLEVAPRKLTIYGTFWFSYFDKTKEMALQKEIFSGYLRFREQLYSTVWHPQSSAQLSFILPFEGKWRLCSVKYFRSDKAAWERLCDGEKWNDGGTKDGGRWLLLNFSWTLGQTLFSTSTMNKSRVLHSKYSVS